MRGASGCAPRSAEGRRGAGKYGLRSLVAPRGQMSASHLAGRRSADPMALPGPRRSRGDQLAAHGHGHVEVVREARPQPYTTASSTPAAMIAPMLRPTRGGGEVAAVLHRAVQAVFRDDRGIHQRAGAERGEHRADQVKARARLERAEAHHARDRADHQHRRHHRADRALALERPVQPDHAAERRERDSDHRRKIPASGSSAGIATLVLLAGTVNGSLTPPWRLSSPASTITTYKPAISSVPIGTASSGSRYATMPAHLAAQVRRGRDRRGQQQVQRAILALAGHRRRRHVDRDQRRSRPARPAPSPAARRGT